MYNKLAGNKRSQAVSELARPILAHSPEHGSPVTEFALKNFCDAKKPQKSYPFCAHLKAAQVRGMVPCVARLAERYCDGTRASKHQVRMMQKLEVCYSIMHREGVIMRPGECAKFQRAGRDFLLEYQWLSQYWGMQTEPRRVYSVIPKHHYWAHLLQDAQWINPRWQWCYMGEEIVGRISSLANSCTKGTAKALVVGKAMDKIRFAQHLEWKLDAGA